MEELERSLGLREALAIGVGTMAGAGIFVFPGIAAGRTGPAAMLSFAIGAAVLVPHARISGRSDFRSPRGHRLDFAHAADGSRDRRSDSGP